MKVFFLSSLFLLFNISLHGHGISPVDIQVMEHGGNLAFIGLGASHMLSGYDHLLFLFGVVFFLNSTRDIIKFVSIFTLGHSLTLIFATFMSITANYYLIDAVIALSIIYKAFDNNKGFENYLKIKSPNLLLMVLIFGLIHGFGLSTRLQEIPLGTQDFTMLLKIVAFNLGVEIGQIVALVFMLLLLKQWKKMSSFTHWSKITNHALMFTGFILFLMQLHGYFHTTYEEEFGFNKDEHYHIHVEMEQVEELEYSHDSL